MASPKVGVEVPAATPRSPQIVSPSSSSMTVKSKNTKKVLAGLAVVGAIVTAAIAVPLASRNAASNSSSTASSKSTNQQVEVDVSAVGCADGTREWYRDTGFSFPYIAGCAGAWTNPGLVEKDEVNGWPVPKGKTGLAQCSAIGNSATKNLAGTGCNGADLCAAGWHLCASAREVEIMSNTYYCDNVYQEPLGGQGFFATAQSGNGNGYCDPLPGSFNDVFGCGTDGSTAVQSNCAPLNRFTHNTCSGFTATGNGWSCGTNGTNEARAITHSTNLGGVLCCKDHVIECIADADGWTITGMGVSDYPLFFNSYVLQASGYSSSCFSVPSAYEFKIAASADVPSEFLVNLYRSEAACSSLRPDESVYCPAYTGGDNEYQDA